MASIRELNIAENNAQLKTRLKTLKFISHFKHHNSWKDKSFAVADQKTVERILLLKLHIE